MSVPAVGGHNSFLTGLKTHHSHMGTRDPGLTLAGVVSGLPETERSFYRPSVVLFVKDSRDGTKQPQPCATRCASL